MLSYVSLLGIAKQCLNAIILEYFRMSQVISDGLFFYILLFVSLFNYNFYNYRDM